MRPIKEKSLGEKTLILLFSFLSCVFIILTNNKRICAANDPILISSAVGFQRSPSVAYSDTENCFIVWEDNRNGSFDIFGAVVYEGMMLGQILICTAPGDQINPVIGWNGTNYFVVWQDKRNVNSFDLFGARVSKMGILLDGPASSSGNTICIAIGDQVNPQLVWNDKDSYLVVWEDYRSIEADIYGTMISSQNLVVSTQIGGMPICTQPGQQKGPTVTFCDSFFLVSWENQIANSSSYIQGKGINNEVEFTINPDNLSPRHPSMASNGNNVIVVWDSINSQGNSDIYATILDYNNQVINDSITICSDSTYNQTNPTVKWTGSYYTIFFKDERNKIFASRISADGLLLDMPAESGAISLDFIANTGNDKAPALSFNNNDSIFLAWEEQNNTNDTDLYGQIIHFSMPPILSWSDEPEFKEVGVSPTEGDNNTLFTFSVKYSHLEGKEPSIARVLIDCNNDGDYTSPHDIVADMSLASFENSPDYIAGVIYKAELQIPIAMESNIRYQFFFSDENEIAIGKPVEGGYIKLINSTPFLMWPNEENYNDNGVHPNEGFGGDRFDFIINCISPEQQLPLIHEVWIDLNGNLFYENNEKFTMQPIDQITYAYTTEIKYTGINYLQYRFFFADSNYHQIIGEEGDIQNPAEDHLVTIYPYKNQPTLSWIKEYQLYQGSIATKEYDNYNITFRIGYSDLDDEPPINSNIWLDLNRNEIIDADEIYSMNLANPYQTNSFIDTVCFTTEIVLPDISSSPLLYKFIFDDGANIADGEPYTEGGMVWLESPIRLDWINEEGFNDDGVKVMIDGNSQVLLFKVNYIHKQNTPPIVKELWLDLDNDNSYSNAEKFEMFEEDPYDNNYFRGKTYQLDIPLTKSAADSVDYRFLFADAYGIASGEPSQEGLSFSLEENIPEIQNADASSSYKSSGEGCFIRSL